jgi:MFS family permease
VVLVEMSSAFGLDVAGLTWYAWFANLLFGLGAIPAGRLADRFGEKALLLAFFWLTAAGGVLVGVAGNTTLLAAGMTLLGIGTSIFHPVGNSLLAKTMHRPGRAMGTNGLWGSLGQAAGPLLAGAIAAAVSWRAAYLVLAPVMVGFALWLGALRIETPRVPTGRFLPTRIPVLIVILLLAMTCAGFNYFLVTTMLPTHIVARTPAGSLDSTLRGASIASFVYFIGGLGQYLSGHLVHHRDGRGLYVLIFLIQAPLVYLTGVLSGTPLIAAACAMSVFLFAAQPIENVLLSRFSPPEWKSTFFGFKFCLAFGIGSPGTPLSGWLQKQYGTGSVFTAGAAFVIAALCFALLALSRRTGAKAREEPAPAEAAAVGG